MPQLWAGIDAGKTEHHCVVIDGNGTKLLSQRFENREAAILTLMGDVASLPGGTDVAWATDLNHGGTGLLQTLLSSYAQPLFYIYATTRGPLVLLTRYATPSAIRRMGESRLASWLKGQGCWKSAAVAKTAVDAAREQTSVVVGEGAAARLVSRSARDLLRIRDEVAELDAEIEAVLQDSRSADLLVSIPGFGRRLAADFLAATGTDLAAPWT
ncbi:transposase [Rathayibacter sp. VKM Ac-2805]|uniref:IS110 family transposase n=1 Tax=Rathayibacter sp. VKM Ac-2805 TaxID=2609258 RepID=UPI0013203D36|nr:transposase [Rathayibacter sp. VKM Ac-2805]QHC72673.1 transposase [Rathayibacter sp. VKM Ac-2805]